MDFYEIDLFINLCKISKMLSAKPVSLEKNRKLVKVPVPALQDTSSWHLDDALRHHLSIASAQLTNMYVDAELNQAETEEFQ